MDPRSMIANRIDLHLRRHLDIGVDTHRALTDERYMRDVLLVCDAMRETDLPLLARQFRVAADCVAQESKRRPGRDAGPPQAWAANTSGFGISQPPVLGDEASQRQSLPWYSSKRRQLS